jgi:hypothetical protein
MTITAPTTKKGYLDRAIDCQSALEPAFEDLAERAEVAGWGRSDVAFALTNLGRLHLRKIVAAIR